MRCSNAPHRHSTESTCASLLRTCLGETAYRLVKVAVYVTLLVGAMIVRFAVVTPSVHDRKTCLPFSVCGEGALTELLEPTITVREKGALALAPLKVSFSPVGLV